MKKYNKIIKNLSAILFSIAYISSVVADDDRTAVYPSDKAYVWIESESVRLETRPLTSSNSVCEQAGMDVRIFTNDESYFAPKSPRLQQLLSEFSKMVMQRCPNTRNEAVVRGYLNGWYKLFAYSNTKYEGRITHWVDMDKAYAERERKKTN